jgi:hypothetical protein
MANYDCLSCRDGEDEKAPVKTLRLSAYLPIWEQVPPPTRLRFSDFNYNWLVDILSEGKVSFAFLTFCRLRRAYLQPQIVALQPKARKVWKPARYPPGLGTLVINGSRILRTSCVGTKFRIV